MHVNYESYDILESLEPALLESLELDESLPVIAKPFKVVVGIVDEQLYEPIDYVFYNTRAFSEAGDTYLKHGYYTSLHPIYDRSEYDAFWDEEERRRKEGHTLPCVVVKKADGSRCLQNLHITGEHYGYLNYAPIKRVSDKVLKEIDTLVKLGKDISQLSAKKEVKLPQFFDSDFYYFKAIEIATDIGKHMVVGKARRKGYSYKNGWLSANRADLYPNTITGIAAYNSDSLYPEGTMTMADNYLQHIGAHTDWSKRRLINKENTIKFGYKYNDGLGIEHGYKSTIIARSFATNNPGAIRGKDCSVILLEESGKNPLLAKVLASTLPTLKAGATVTGIMIVFGTGGGEDKQWEGFEELFYSPSADGFMCFNNIWDEDGKGSECGFFVPSFMGKEGFIDEHGNSNVKGAIRYENELREQKKKSKSANKLTDYIMEEPFNPKEAFSRGGSGIFPAVELEEQLKRVQRDPNIRAITRTGNLVRTAKGVTFKDKIFMSPEELKHYHPPIFNFPLKREDDAHGCFVMWSPPYRTHGIITGTSNLVSSGVVPDKLYRIWHDPFALPKDSKDVTGRDSLGVFYVFERSNNFTPGLGDRLVATFRGRPSTTDEFNDIMFKAADYYNAMIMAENDRGDVYNYAREHKRLHQLEDEPEVIWKKALQGKKTGRKKGISINKARKRDGVVYVRDWLLEKRNKLENGINLLNLHYIYDEPLLKELLKFNLDKGNFDGVSTMIVGQYDIKEQFFNEIKKPVPKTQQGFFDRPLY
jgi:hypothetical protein